MRDDFKRNLGSYIDGMVASYHENRISEKENPNLPDRDVIIGIIEDIEKLLFPQYFGDQNIDTDTEKYIVGNLMQDLYVRMKAQIALAFLYRYDYRESFQCKALIDEAEDKAEEVCAKFFEELPEVHRLLALDIQAAFDGDPAAENRDQIVFSYPGIKAISIHRVAHIFYKLGVPIIPRIMSEYAHSNTGIDIHPGATLGESFFIDHGTGIVIGETTEIGKHVKIYQGVTLGALSTRNADALRLTKRHPTIEDCVTIYAGATILGGETVIGHNSVIGASVFITESLPPHSIVSAQEEK